MKTYFNVSSFQTPMIKSNIYWSASSTTCIGGGRRSMGAGTSSWGAGTSSWGAGAPTWGACAPFPMIVVTPPIQLYTNHTRKCVQSRSGTHKKISQHNSKSKISHISIILQGRGIEYKCSNIDESAEATISEYRHKLNKLP